LPLQLLIDNVLIAFHAKQNNNDMRAYQLKAKTNFILMMEVTFLVLVKENNDYDGMY
jgi:hypothetical protein